MRSIATVFSGLVLFMLAASACGQETIAGPPRADRSVLVTDDHRLVKTHEAPYLLRDISKPATLYLSNVDMHTGECRFYMSTNGGTSWTKREAPSLPPYTNCAVGQAQPQNLRTELRQGSDGTLYYMYQANETTPLSGRSVLVGRSRDAGQTWQTVAIDAAAKAVPNVPINVNFVGHLAIDPGNQKHMVAMWRRSQWGGGGGHGQPSVTRPFMATSDDGGATWTPPVMAFDKNPGFDGPRPILADGKLYAFYRESAPPATAGQPPPQTPLWSSVSADGGKTWKDSKIAQALDASEPVPVYDSSRHVFNVFWHDNRTGDLDIYYSRSKDASTWSEPARLNDDPPGNRRGQFYPQASLAPDGRLDVAWYDFRNDPYAAPAPRPPATALNLSSNLGKDQDVYATYSRDGGMTWAKNLKVNDARIDRTKGTWNSQYFFVVPPTVASLSDRIVVAWSDTRTGDSLTAAQDIFTGTLKFESPESDSGWVLAASAGIGVIAGAGLALLLVGLALRRRRLVSDSSPRT